MRNIIRADLYRIFRSWGIYVALIAFLAFVILQTVTAGAGAIGADIETLQNPNAWEEVETDGGAIVMRYNAGVVDPCGTGISFILATGTGNLIYLLLPLIAIIAAGDFSCGTVKNLLASGVSRYKYFGAKLILVSLSAVLIALVYVALPIIIAEILRGHCGEFNIDFFAQLAKIYLPQTFILITWGFIGMFLTFALKSKAALISIYLGYSMGTLLIFFLIASATDEISKLIEYNLTFMIDAFGYPDGAMPASVPRMLIVGGAHIAFCVIAGLTIFRKSEVK